MWKLPWANEDTQSSKKTKGITQVFYDYFKNIIVRNKSDVVHLLYYQIISATCRWIF